MATDSLGSLIVSLVAETSQFNDALSKAAYQTNQQMGRIVAATKSVTAELKMLERGLATISGGALTVGGLVTAFDAIKSATIESEQSMLQLDAALKATQGSAGLTTSDLQEMARAIKASTVFSTEDITKAETALLRFRDIRKDVFDEAMRQVPDLAAALGTSLPEAAQKLGRALEDPTKGLRALREAGVFLDETQLALSIHFSQLGDKAKSQKIVMDAVAASTGGAALAATLGLSGATDKLARSLKDLETASGKKLFGENHALLAGMQTLFENLTKRIEESTFSLTNWLAKAAAVALAPATGGASLGFLIGGAGAPDTVAQRTAKGIIGGQSPGELSAEQDAARQAALDADIARRIDARTIAQFNALKVFAEKSAQFYASDTALQKFYTTLQTSQLEFSYSQGETATAEYYGALESIAKRSFTDQDQIFSKRVQAEEAILKSEFSTEADRDAARARMAAIVGQTDTARLAMHERLNALSQQSVVAVQKLKDEYVDLAAAIAEASGNTAGAAVARFDIANRARSRQFTAEASSLDPTQAALGAFGLDALNAERQHVQIVAALSDAEKKFSTTLGEVAVKQGAIDLAQSTGSVSELRALGEKADLAKSFIAQLTAEAAAYDLIAQKSHDPADILHAQQLNLELAKVVAQANAVGDAFDKIATDNFAVFLQDLVGHTKTVAQAFLDMGKGIESAITKLITEDLAKRLYKSLFGDAGVIGGPSLGSMLAGLLGFGGAGGASPLANFGAGDSFGGGLGGYASGTDYVPRTGLYLVHQGEKIIAAAQNKGGQGGDVHNHLTVNVLPGATRQSTDQAADAMLTRLQRARARVG
jgi:hypothetical protein